MFYRVRQRFNRLWFHLGCQEILSAPPVKPTGDQPVIVTLLSHSDLMMYLVAIKSFYHYLGQGRIVVLDDGSLTSQDTNILKNHIHSFEVIKINEMKPSKYYYDVSWKRFAIVCDLVKENYVIQMDSDSLTRGPIPEVLDCINNNKSFILGTKYRETVAEIEPMITACERVGPDQTNFFEKYFDKYPDNINKKYIRGGAAFTGCYKGSFTWDDVIEFSENMEKLSGKEWQRWGAEQVTVSYIIANTPGAVVLPFPRYASFYLSRINILDQSPYLHFIGVDRFKKGYYINSSRKLIKELLKKTKKRE